MVQQDNKPNNETTVDGKPLYRGQPKNSDQPPLTHEYVQGTERDDDPLLSEEERGNTRGDLLHEHTDRQHRGPSHPV